MAPATSTDQRNMVVSTGTNLATTSALMQQENRKRPAPIHVAPPAKQRRGLVQRTHSPKSQVSPLSSPYVKQTPLTPSRQTCKTARFEVKKMSPTVNGVTEAANLMNKGEVVVIPTETIYLACTSITPQHEQQASTKAIQKLLAICSRDAEWPILVVQRPLATLERAIPFAHKPYAIHERDGTSSPPVVFSEQKEVLSRLAKKFWPGPLVIYLNQQQTAAKHGCCDGSAIVPWFCVNASSSSSKRYYVGISNPSHPLTNRLLKETFSPESYPHAPQRVVVATAVRTNSCGTNRFMTKADDVCSHFASQVSPASEPATKPPQQHPVVIHVMNGEDKRELFSVPTCQYGKPHPYSLWIDDGARVVYIRGSHSESGVDTARRQPQHQDVATTTTSATTPGSVAGVVKAVLTSAVASTSSSPSTTNDNRLQNRNRVIAAVLRKWKVVDQRTTIL